MKISKQIPIGTKSGERKIASTILWGYHRSNMTGWNDDNAVMVENRTEQNREYSTSIFLGNMYGLHDGYDGSVFSIYGLCKTITRSLGGIADILVYEKDNSL